MTDDNIGGKIRRPRASVDDTESFLTAMHPSPAPETPEIASLSSRSALQLRSRPDRCEHDLPGHLIAKHSHWLQVVS
jgi:hypothetical protein